MLQIGQTSDIDSHIAAHGWVCSQGGVGGTILFPTIAPVNAVILMAAESPCSSISGAPYLHSHWTDALSEHPIFGHLAEECCINSNEERIAVCQAHGDLFVWDPINQLILTTNLKRLHGNVTAVEEAIHESPVRQIS